MGVGVDKFVERGEKRIERGARERAQGGEGELDEREFVFGANVAEVGAESVEMGECAGSGVLGDEGALAFAEGGVVGKKQAVEEDGSARLRVGGVAEGRRDGREEVFGRGDLGGGEGADGGDGGRGGEGFEF